MICAQCVLQAHTQDKLVRLQMYVLVVLLTQPRKTPALQKQTVYVTQDLQVLMEDRVSTVLQENTRSTLDLANVHYVQ